MEGTSREGQLTVGTAEGNTLRLADPTVSRYHVELEALAGGVAVRDLGSTNGVVLGAARLREALFTESADLDLGRTRLRMSVASDREVMREALAAPDDDWVRRQRRDLDEAHTIVRRNVGELELRGGPAGARVSVDGVTLGQLPLDAPLRLRAGVVTVEVRAAAHFPFTRQVTILGGELTREPVSLTALPREVLSPSPPPAPVVAVSVSPPIPVRPVERRAPTASWVLGGAGAVLVVGGGASVVLRELSAGRFNRDCPDLNAVSRGSQSDDCQRELATGDWTTVTIVVGFAGGAVLWGRACCLPCSRGASRRLRSRGAACRPCRAPHAPGRSDPLPPALSRVGASGVALALRPPTPGGTGIYDLSRAVRWPRRC